MKDPHKEKLKQFVRKEVTELFQQVLNYTQVACADPATFRVLRSKILRVGNDCIRHIHASLEEYEVKYIPNKEDVIEICRKK